MARTNCCGETLKPSNDLNYNYIPMNKEQLAQDIFTFMDPIVKFNGPSMSMTTDQIRTAINYHNQYFNTHLSQHLMNECKSAIINIKALYHQIRRGEITYESAEISNTTTVPIEETKVDNDISTNNTISTVNETEVKVDKRSKEYKQQQANK